MNEPIRHSRGPWRMDEARIRDGYGNLIGFIYPTELLFKSEHDANVNLMVAAPELLDACEEIDTIKDALIAFLMNHEDALAEMQLLNLVRAIGKRGNTAIAKAKGENQC